MTLKPQLLFITALLLVVISAIACIESGTDDFASAKEVIVMRNIGHQILLSSGDSSSRVLPVSKINGNQYQIRFGNAFQFTPDSVIKIIRQAVATNHLPTDYIVSITESQNKQIVYGFAVLKKPQTSIVPCKGRTQLKARYIVNITFQDTGSGILKKNYLVGVGGSLATVMLILSGLKFNRQNSKKSKLDLACTPEVSSPIINIGWYKFDQNSRRLELNQEQINLSDKEAKLLNILANQINIVVERPELQKVWEDDGVIVGRSLDMFISRLRKKLDQDPLVKIVNVHGKGYKLEVA
jgi:hypothetical protein